MTNSYKEKRSFSEPIYSFTTKREGKNDCWLLSY